MANTPKKFTEDAPQAPDTGAGENPFTKPIETAPAPAYAAPAPTTPISTHDQLWQDTKALIRSARRLGVDFEVLLRGALQEVEKGL